MGSVTQHAPENVSRPVGTPSASGNQAAAFIADLVAVLAFAALGRRAHDEGSVLVGTLATAAPFLAGTAAGWGCLRLLARMVPSRVMPPWTDGRTLPAGGVVLVWTVTLGMLLRHVTGRGVAGSFVIVATTFLALLLLGRRAVARWRVSRRGAG